MDITNDFLDEKKKKKEKDKIDIFDVEEWIEDGEYLKFFKKWRKDMWKKLFKEIDYSRSGVDLHEIMKNPPAYGYNYQMYLNRARKNRDHFDL